MQIRAFKQDKTVKIRALQRQSSHQEFIVVLSCVFFSNRPERELNVVSGGVRFAFQPAFTYTYVLANTFGAARNTNYDHCRNFAFAWNTFQEH
jgi:hypothetical protein